MRIEPACFNKDAEVLYAPSRGQPWAPLRSLKAENRRAARPYVMLFLIAVANVLVLFFLQKAASFALFA